jgi:hypothetical protein
MIVLFCLYVAVQPFLVTILPPTHLPTGRLPRGLCRYSARYIEAHNDRNIDSSIEPNNDANVFWNNVSNDFAYKVWYCAAYSRSFSSLHGSRGD